MKKFILRGILFNGVAFIWAAGFCANAKADDYLGASSVLQQVEERHAKPVSKQTNEVSELQDDLKAFSGNAASLAPADAAKRWLELVDRAVTVQKEELGNSDQPTSPVTGDDLLAALPPPAAWGELARAIAARPAATQEQEQIREMGLRLLAAALTGNVAAENLEMTNLELKANQADSQTASVYASLLEQFSEAMVQASGNHGFILQSLERQINAATPGNLAPIQVPNLVAQIGPKKAEEFLRKALVAPNITLQFEKPSQTSRLAQKLGLQLVGQMKAPQWGLINSLDAVELYEAMDKRFGGQTNNAPFPVVSSSVGFSSGSSFQDGSFMDSQKDTARIYYMLGLISEGRTADAVAVAKKFEADQSNEFDDAFNAMDQAGYAVELDNFLNQLLTQNPKLPFWDPYVEFAAKAGQTSRMVALVRSTLARSDLSERKKAELHQILFKALLADDDVAEGVQEMRQLIATNGVSSETGDNYNAGELGALLARIGVLTTNSEWTEEGIAAAKQWLASPAGQNNSDWEAGPVISSLTQTLLELNRGPEAESILADALANVTRPGNSQPNYGYWNGSTPSRSILGALEVLYYKAGRYDDVLYLLQNSPDWSAKDLSDLFEYYPLNDEFSVTSLHTDSSSSSLLIPYIAACALAAKGRTEEAQRIDDAVLDKSPELDRGYELLISLKGTNAIPQLDEMFKADQFQPRPLIWKAHLLQQEGQLEEAEKIVRQAIAIDPSDGEQGPGDRMRAYAELADIREARGDQKEADFYRQVVKAIRISENADQYYLAGLLKRAINMYQEGLDHFADAYCIQSRMAIQLAALGKTEEAAEHYRRAYELMPDSFGRVESHCFGCERVFKGQQAQSIAEKVFTQLVAERPNKPQVYYLLGYLQEEEDRDSEAWTNFQIAVRLDPDYLNAWKELDESQARILVPTKEREKIAFNILRLDPLQQHSSPDFSSVTDLPSLWNAVAVATQFRPKSPSDLLPLTASKIALEKALNNANPEDRFRIVSMMGSQNDQDLTPARAVAQTPYVECAGELILDEDFDSMDQ